MAPMRFIIADKINTYLSPQKKQSLKRNYLKIKSKIINAFYAYTPNQLENQFREMGISKGDTVLMHSSFNVFNGFKGEVQQVIDCILNVVGASGNVAMMSMAYTGSSYDYLKAGKPFDVKKTVSRMGLITEIFRRRSGVLRSAHPLHSILAYGPQAAWLIADHEKTVYSCGKGSPFEKLLALNAKALFFDVPFMTFSFVHYLEDLFKDNAPVKVYRDELLESIVIDANRNELKVKTFAFSEEAIRSRNFHILEEELIKNNLMKIEKIGNTKLLLVNIQDVVNCACKMVRSGRHFYRV